MRKIIHLTYEKPTCCELSLPDSDKNHMPKTQGAARLIRSISQEDEITTVQQLAISRRTALNKILSQMLDYF